MDLILILLGSLLIFAGFIVVIAFVGFIVVITVKDFNFKMFLTVLVPIGLVLLLIGVGIHHQQTNPSVEDKEISIIQIYDTQGNLIEEYEVQH